MKIFRYVMMAALLLGVSGVARAFTFQVLDPPGPQGLAPNIGPGSTVTFGFYSCPAAISNEDGCFDAVNVSSETLTSFTATIQTNDPLSTADTSGTGAECPTSYTPEGGNKLTNAFSTVVTCTGSGNTINITLSGTPGIAPLSTLWIVETGIDPSEFTANAGTFTVGPVPEPSSIWMALSGTGVFGYLVRRRRRDS